MTRPNFDPAALVERSCQAYGCAADWIRALAADVASALDPGHAGACGFEYSRSDGPSAVVRVPAPRARAGAATSGLDGYLGAWRAEGMRLLAACCAGATPMLEAEPAGGVLPRNGAALSSTTVAIVVAGLPPVLFGTLSEHPPRFDAAVRGLWSLLSSLLASGLRSSLGPAAVVAPADRVLEVWRGLFWGRWRLVDLERDGEIVACECRVPTHVPPRQRQALFLAAAGWSNKEIGYFLQISEATAAGHLSRAMRAVGLRSRSQWVRLSAAVQRAVSTTAL